MQRRGSRGSRRVKLALVGVMLFLLAIAMYVSVLIVRRQQALSEVSRYNTAWLVSQAAVEVARLEATVAAAAAPGTGVGEDEVQLRLDIIANRVQLFGSGEAADYFRTDPGWPPSSPNSSALREPGRRHLTAPRRRSAGAGSWPR